MKNSKEKNTKLNENNKKLKFRERNIFCYAIILIISILVSLPFLKISLLGTGDTRIHLLRIIGLRNSIIYSKFPYIIAPFYCNNFGYATNLFYPQFVTYIPYMLKVFTSSYENAMELFAFFTIFASGITMYNFTHQVSKNKIIALISSIIYLTFPYRFECIYERFAIGEFTALIFIPVLFQGLYNLIEGDKSKHYLIAIGTIGMLLCHTITTLYSAIFCVIYLAFNYKKFFKKDVIKLCAINAVFIILITSFFTIPLIEHKMSADYAIFNAEIMRGEGEDVWDNSASFKQLLTDAGSDKTVSFIIGIPIIIYVLLAIGAYKKIETEDKKWYGEFAILSAISLFMVTKLFPWMIMPNTLTMVQFSWRILVFLNLFLSPICAINIYTIFKNINNKKIAIGFLTICTAILVVFTSARLLEFVKEKTETAKGNENYEQRVLERPKISPMSINREYLPTKALQDGCEYIKKRKDNVYVLEGNCSIFDEKKDALNLSFSINNEGKTILELPFIYYLGYDIKIEENGNVQQLNYSESENGFIQITIPDNIKSANLSITYSGTTIEKMAYVISIIGVIIFIVYGICWHKSYRGESYEKTGI